MKNVTVSKSLEEREVARAQGQPAGKEEGSESSDESGPLPLPKYARVVPGCRLHRLRIPICHMTCRDGKLEKLLLKQPAVRTFAARRVYQTAVRTFLKYRKEYTLPLVGDVEIIGALVVHSTNCFALRILHHHGSQFRAAVMDRRPSFSRSGSSKLLSFQ